MGTTDEAARVIRNLVTVVYGIAVLAFLGGFGYLVVSCAMSN